MQRIAGRASSRLVVGVLEAAATERNADSAVSVLTVAIVHEFGGGDLPARSFIRAWADENVAANRTRLRGVAQQVLRGAPERELLEAMGREMVLEVRARMARTERLDPDTVERTGRTTPLVGGQLERAVASEVRS
jgi:hypothetical protein